MLAPMSDSPDPRQLAAAARRARAGQIHALRLRVAAIALALFIGAWAVIGVQLVTGHDPALANDVTPVAVQAADAGTTDDEASSDATTTDGGTDAQTSGSGADPPSSGSTTDATTATGTSEPAAVTTGQS
jgi:hypothetical protein